MGEMIFRTTFSLDGASKRRLKRLSSIWSVSQAEVVRRSLEKAESMENTSTSDPLALLKAYHRQGGMDPERAKAAKGQTHRLNDCGNRYCQ